MSENRPDREDAAAIIADLLCSTLQRGHDEGRRDLYVWERRGLAWLSHALRSGDVDTLNAWTAARVRAFEREEPILPGWRHSV